MYYINIHNTNKRYEYKNIYYKLNKLKKIKNKDLIRNYENMKIKNNIEKNKKIRKFKKKDLIKNFSYKLNIDRKIKFKKNYDINYYLKNNKLMFNLFFFKYYNDLYKNYYDYRFNYIMKKTYKLINDNKYNF